MKKQKLEAVETIKTASNYLRGGIADGLDNNVTGSLAEDDTQLTKFHGIYQQHDRESVVTRRKQKLEPLYSFMIRARVPAGICTPEQWLAMDDLAVQYGGGSIRLTTRQAFQLHGVIKKNLKTTIASINQSLLDTIAACGDVNRNVMCTPNPHQSEVHQQAYQAAAAISSHLTPQTTAYHEIWLDKEKVAGTPDIEPIYGETYLPRKFKIAMAIPPANDVDVFAHDLGFIAVVEKHQLIGFNVTVGGGMGATHGDLETFPLLAQVIGFCAVDQVTQVAEQVVKIQRDYGCRTNRKHARFKYTIDDRGIDWFKQELNKRLGWSLLAEKPFEFKSTGDEFGWSENYDGTWNLCLFIQNGRVIDSDSLALRSALKQVAHLDYGDFRITANQNLIIGQLTADEKAVVIDTLTPFGVLENNRQSLAQLNGMACVALPTCSLAMAEAERYLPTLLNKIENLQIKHGIQDRAIITRMTGCPNGCARPYMAELGFVGKGPGKYNMYLGGEFTGTRLNRMYLENIDEDTILIELDALFADYASNALDGEWFGDFVIRQGHIDAVTHGSQVHLPLAVV
ncbi:NADPH-dependent assimilatory sulfite reductase hemoprotein subunit [Marinicella sp. S1101]|uniref:NADPH-dependent assimilatory sulfite reductase hemoprotein subunit n=1 Tax=Marinicella marina TaxID=2996016 RepID=UPI0022608826|nr:NADPH-dependent assimilatory sulfite reductase hemoprotein subunit [Marinicella marina]MCX7552699.1 NADPH-dependent assimilatory sulfite reductase hemoprotein subunit [Marinicella marina]MDJ1139992.1 NADPH-dependent assimilatory sulfite reductase hemoprotein subunit [Marinicella marina]